MKKGALVFFCYACCTVLFMPVLLAEETGKDRGLSLSVNFISYGRTTGLRTINDGSTLLSGERYAIYFAPEQDCFVYIYQIDSAGNTFHLFPMERFGRVVLNNTNPVKKGGVYYIPSETQWFKLDNTVGEERIYLIASREKLEEFEKAKEESAAAGVAKTGDLKQRLNQYFKSRGRDASEQAGNRRSVAGPEGEKGSFEVFDRRISTLGDSFVKVLKFVHK